MEIDRKWPRRLLPASGSRSTLLACSILWRYGLPEALIRGGFGYVDPIVESDPVEKARADQYNMWSRVALYLIVGGFFLQIVGAWLPTD